MSIALSAAVASWARRSIVRDTVGSEATNPTHGGRVYTPSDVRGRCAVVVPVAGQLARAAATLNDADLDVLRAVARRSGSSRNAA